MFNWIWKFIAKLRIDGQRCDSQLYHYSFALSPNYAQPSTHLNVNAQALKREEIVICEARRLMANQGG
jgi:hypothetical protein